MELILKTYSHLTWQFRTFKPMLSGVPFATAVGTGAIVLSRFAQLFAFFLPLKVLIMLSSDRVPHVFAGLITAENKHLWLVAFSLATFILYSFSISLVTLANRTITRGFDRLVQRQYDLPKAQKKRLRRLYNIYCQASSEALVFLLGSIVLAFFNPLVLVGMIVVVMGELVLTGWILDSKVGGFLGWIRGGINRNVNSYIQYLSAANFLALFVLIVVDYFIHGEINVYMAILTMILGRQTFNSLTKFVKRMLSLDEGDEDDE